MIQQFIVTNRFSGKTQFIAEIECDENELQSTKLGLAVRWAIKTHANLKDTYLRRAYLKGANLAGAYLKGADLTGTHLGGACLRRVDLTGANLTSAYLRRADLTGAVLTGADLTGAVLTGADLRGADLRGADLTDASLTGADLGNTKMIVDGGQRSDGYRVVGWIKDGVLQIRAGCRDFDIIAARTHWLETRSGTALGDETMAILNHIEMVAKIRGLTE
jgi:hypothetical protein